MKTQETTTNEPSKLASKSAIQKSDPTLPSEPTVLEQAVPLRTAGKIIIVISR